MKFVSLLIVITVIITSAACASGKICAAYTGICSFAGRQALDECIKTEPTYLMDKHKTMMASADCEKNIKMAKETGFDTLFISIYPLYGFNWWTVPSARNLVKDALKHSSKDFKVHLGLSMYNERLTRDHSKYPGALQAIKWDGKKPGVVCFLDDSLWKFNTRVAVELAKIGNELPGTLDGIFLDPEPYGPEANLCFCDNCIRKFNRFAKAEVPLGLENPFSWIAEHGYREKYVSDWHDQEVQRQAAALRIAVHKVNPKLQLSSFLWDPLYWDEPVKQRRETFWRNITVGLGTEKKPSWAMPETTYYSDPSHLAADIKKIQDAIDDEGWDRRVKVLPGLMPVGQQASSLVERGKVIRSANVVGYWLYQFSVLEDGTKDTPDGPLLEPAANYRKALQEMNKTVGRD
jgi:hypothetical protein